jgi:mannose-6-phosphate isomerase-like protein (cupin superfamily)
VQNGQAFDKNGVPTEGVPVGPESLYRVVDFGAVTPTPCPCGEARRAFADESRFPGTLHVTSISVDAKRHFHRKLTETYFILECDAGAYMELNEDRVQLRPGMAVLIPPGTIHRAVGKMKVLIVVSPNFDPADEFVVGE